jgi:superfamily II DNA/RNA helicase
VPSALVERRDERTPLLITFEDMARGLHFEAVETVFILGMPDSPATYLHLAGRTGRQGRKGSVVTVCPGAAFEQLLSWSQRLGGIRFEELAADEVADEAADDEAVRALLECARTLCMPGNTQLRLLLRLRLQA